MSKGRSCFSMLFSHRAEDISPKSTAEDFPIPVITTVTSLSSVTVDTSASPVSTTSNSTGTAASPMTSSPTETIIPVVDKKNEVTSPVILKSPPAPIENLTLSIAEIITPSLPINSPSTLSTGTEENDPYEKKEEKKNQNPPTLHRSNASSDLVDLQEEEAVPMGSYDDEEDDEHQARNWFVKYILCFNVSAINLETCNKKQTLIYSVRTALSLCLATLAGYSTQNTMNSMAAHLAPEEQKESVAIPLSCAVSLATYFFAQVTFRYFIGDKDVNPHEKRIARLERKMKFFKNDYEKRLRDVETVLAPQLKQLRKTRKIEAKALKK